MATEAVSANASIASTGRTLRSVGSFIYGYSGAVDCDNTETDLINSNSGTGVIYAEIFFDYLESAGTEDFLFRVYLNDLLIYAYTKDQATDASPGNWFPKLIVPPFSHLKITAQNITDTTPREMAVGVTGRVYGV